MPETHPDNIQSDADDVAQETVQIRRVALFAFLLNLFLAGLKIILAALSGSLSITAGAIDSATDSVASLAVFLGVVLSARKTKTFPLGLYKIENLISVVMAIFIFFAGYEIVQHMMQPGEIPRITWPILVLLLLSTAITYAFGLYALYLGRKTESPTLIAEGKHRQVDV
ncbi:MAG: cation diffusion facilitator family transporter, partial [Thermodesulfobacteriota bacterium]